MQELVKQQWLIPLFPLVAAAIQSVLPRGARRLSATLTIGAMAVSCLFALRALAGTAAAAAHAHGDVAAVREIVSFTWLRFGTVSLDLGFVLDPLTAGMAAMVTFVGLMIFINATGYMAEDENFTRFFCFLSLFAAAMLGLVVANNLLLLFMCWELVGLCSYLLIGFWYHKPAAAAAMKKAFITTRIGDVGFFLGILLLYWQTGTLQLYDHGHGALEQAGALALLGGWWGLSMATWIALLVFCGAMGKSAQFPLHVWLPDAMEGPTPVSALIHAATMVAAGVFVVGRMFPLFEAEAALPGGSRLALDVVMWVGCFTALFAATIAVAQWDIKRVLAYSTCSQLGYMMLALGAGGLAAGQFHLLTHAFFKALLFLGAGSVIVGTHHEQDMRRMGGLRRYMPITFLTYAVGMLALAGFPGTAGFFSKDEVLLAAWHQNKLVWGLATATAFLTAFYMTRQVCLVFFGKWRGGPEAPEHGSAPSVAEASEGKGASPSPRHGHGGHEPHETPWNMTLPLVVLAVAALFLGWFGTPWFRGNLFHHFVAPDAAAPHHSSVVLWSSIGVGLLGLFLGWAVYGRRTMASAAEPDPLAAKLGPLFTWMNRKWYIDEVYEATILRFTAGCGRFFRLVDKLVVDGILHAIAWIVWGVSQVVRWGGDELMINGGFDAGCEGVRGSSRWLSRLQTGRVQSYLRGLGLGTIVLLVLYFWVT
ncbi:NADH-quinone oxidoreductase subunit L [bacterium]|nr:NADH-quinone oxidoreductase subunit L [bacterium]